MQTPMRLAGAVILFSVAAWSALLPGVAHAEHELPSLPAPGPCTTAPAVSHSLEQLALLSWEELEQLYRQSGPGTIPTGYARGRAIYCPEARLAATRGKVTRLLWHGKHFCAADGTLVNQWCGFKAIRAAVCHGPSWLDGAPSIIMDYSGTSRVWSDVRDELREVAPGLYLGAMFLRREPRPKFKMFFILDCQSPQTCRPCQLGDASFGP